jgi:hypothetical protein
MRPGDLTTLANVKGWAQAQSPAATASDEILGRLISAASAFVLSFLQRDSLAVQTVTETYDGYGNNFMVLRQWPALSIQSIALPGLTITTPATGNPRCNGFLLDPGPPGGGEQKVTLFGSHFPRGRASIDVTYTVGYQIPAELWTLPASGAGVVTPFFTWLADGGVKFTDTGAALTRAASGTPAEGQYVIATDAQGNTTYTFAAADAGRPVALTYSFTPADVEQATIELVGEWFKRKDRIGQNSVNLGNGQTISFSVRDMSPAVRAMLQPYMRIVPG